MIFTRRMNDLFDLLNSSKPSQALSLGEDNSHFEVVHLFDYVDRASSKSLPYCNEFFFPAHNSCIGFGGPYYMAKCLAGGNFGRS